MSLIDRLCGVVAALAVSLLLSASAEAGALLGPTLGKLLSNLKASGYKPHAFVPVNYGALN